MLALVGLVMTQAMLQTLAPTTIAQGSDSEITEPREVVVRDVEEWRTLWRAHTSQPAPEVDFSRSVVVGVFVGFRPTAGFRVEITAVSAKQEHAIVQFVERRPPPGTLVAQVVTFPFHLVALPRDIRTFEFKRIEPAP